MKSLARFLTEAAASKSLAVQQATRLGYTSDGHGGWYDKQGEFVAKTEGGKLKLYNKNQRIGKRDPDQERSQQSERPVGTQTKTPAQAEKQAVAPIVPHKHQPVAILHQQGWSKVPTG